MCKIKYFICDPVSVTKKIATSSSKNEIKDFLFLLEEVAIFFVTKTWSQIKYLILHISFI